MSSKEYRMQELINPATGLSLVVDTSNGLALGALPGLEHYAEAVTPVLPWADAVVASPGQSRKLLSRTRQDASVLVCGDWTNALRGEDFVLPPEHINYIAILEATAARDLGASGLVMHFLLGHSEAIDAQCLKAVVNRSLEGTAVGMPLIVNVHPIGPRVVLMSKAIELGVSYALEGGADGIAIPWPGASSFESIAKMTDTVPVWIKPETVDVGEPVLVEMLAAGATGFWLNESVFASGDPVATVRNFHQLLHQPVEV